MKILNHHFQTKMAFPITRCCLLKSTKSIFPLVFRGISTTSAVNSKKNFRKFPYMNRGTSEFNETQRRFPDPNLPSFRYGRPPGYFDEEGNIIAVPEMIPELVVPDLTGFQLKPYVSYRVPDTEEPPFTAKDLFYSVYADKMEADYKSGKLDENGGPLEPDENELLTPQEARNNALKLGNDIFTDEENIVNDSEWMKEQPKMEYN